ncbi:MAG TPA: hypothetical protein VD887_10620 [Allosphingosinicella sp.]|nr:hypothetical protein [Allosphingosinicella sp.]
MAEGSTISRLGLLGALLRPRLVRFGLLIWGALVSYDTLCSQLGLPTIREVWGMSGALLSWWGWLLVLQAILVYALFEYVRTQGVQLSIGKPASGGIDSRIEKLEALASAGALKTPEKPKEPEPKPDMQLTAVIVRLYSYWGGAPAEENLKPGFYYQMNLKLIDAINLEGLHVWGRLGQMALVEIEPHYLSQSVIDHRKGEIIVGDDFEPTVYRDLYFNQREIDRIWPRKSTTDA